MVLTNVARRLGGNVNAEAKMRSLRQVYFLCSRLQPAICNPPFLLGSNLDGTSGFTA